MPIPSAVVVLEVDLPARSFIKHINTSTCIITVIPTGVNGGAPAGLVNEQRCAGSSPQRERNQRVCCTRHPGSPGALTAELKTHFQALYGLGVCKVNGTEHKSFGVFHWLL